MTREELIVAIIEGVMGDPRFQSKVMDVQSSGASRSRLSHGGKSFSTRRMGNTTTVKRNYLGGLVKRKVGSAIWTPNK